MLRQDIEKIAEDMKALEGTNACKLVTIFVNGNCVDAKTFTDPDLAGKIDRYLRSWNVPPNSCTIADC